MDIKNFKDVELSKTPHNITARNIYDSDLAVVMHLTLKPKEKLIPHITPVDALFYVLKGTPTILVGDEEKVAKEGDIVLSPKKIVHSISNNSDKEAMILVTKLPKPVAATKFVK